MHPILNVPDTLEAKIIVAAISAAALILFIVRYFRNGRL
jgi:hypothetical protein